MIAITIKNGFVERNPKIKRIIRKGKTITKVWIKGVVYDEDRDYFIVENNEVRLTN